MREDREERTKIDALDLLISVLREHEKSLDRISARLEKQLNRLTDAVTRLETFRTEAAARGKPKRKQRGRREPSPEGRPG